MKLRVCFPSPHISISCFPLIFAGVKLKRNYNLSAPKGVNGRNSDNTLIQQAFGWEPGTRLKDGLEKTYAWIHDQIRSGSTKQ